MNRITIDLENETVVCHDDGGTPTLPLATAEELEAYAPLVSPQSYIIATDGIMEDVAGAPRTEADGSWNNPRQAALEFVKTHADFRIEQPPFLFNEGTVTAPVTYWPSAYIRWHD